MGLNADFLPPASSPSTTVVPRLRLRFSPLPAALLPPCPSGKAPCDFLGRSTAPRPPAS